MAKRRILGKNTRFGVALASGLAAALAVGTFGNWELAALVGWDVLAVVLMLLIVRDFAGHRGAETATVARRDDMQQSMVDVIILVAALASIGGVLLLMAAKDGVEHLVVGVVSIVVSWLMVQVLFTLRYATLYYHGTPGGIDFNDKELPEFSDFAYVAFTLGMTYQVSDTNVTSRAMRRAVLQQALISFVFGVMIIATTINLLAGLLQK